MDNLSRIIGPAPSELSWEDLRGKIGSERERVREAIDYWREGGGVILAKRGGGKKKPEPGFSNRELKLMAKELDISMKELNVLMNMARKEKEG